MREAREIPLTPPPGAVSRPSLDVAAATRHLAGSCAVRVLSSCPSTNTVLLESLTTADGALKDLQVLATEHQTAGLGRLGRGWVTPERAALTFSVGLIPIGVPSRHWGWLPMLTGLAVVQSLRSLHPALHPGLKWPNDVLIAPAPDGRPGKVAGILVSTTGDTAVVGVGLNVSQLASELPVETATSLVLAGIEVGRTRLLVDTLRAFVELVDEWRSAGGDATSAGIADEIRAATVTLNQQVRIDLPGGAEPLTGWARDIDDGGRLVVDTRNGGSQTVSAGDVHHVRIAE